MHTAHYHRHKHYYVLQYMVLLLMLTIGFFAFAQSSGTAEKQMQIGIVTASAYVLWGIFHHLYDHDLKWKIVIEYAVIALFGLGLLWNILSLT